MGEPTDEGEARKGSEEELEYPAPKVDVEITKDGVKLSGDLNQDGKKDWSLTLKGVSGYAVAIAIALAIGWCISHFEIIV